jgi:hypothetical protein
VQAVGKLKLGQWLQREVSRHGENDQSWSQLSPLLGRSARQLKDAVSNFLRFRLGILLDHAVGSKDDEHLYNSHMQTCTRLQMR